MEYSEEELKRISHNEKSIQVRMCLEENLDRYLDENRSYSKRGVAHIRGKGNSGFGSNLKKGYKIYFNYVGIGSCDFIMEYHEVARYCIKKGKHFFYKIILTNSVPDLLKKHNIKV
jgi:hypothetical protein